MRKHCLLRLTAMLLACILLIGCSAPGQQAAAAETASSGNAAEAPAASAAASAAQTGKQLPQMHRQDYPCYIGSLDYSLTEPFPLYFADGADDLPYVELYSADDFKNMAAQNLASKSKRDTLTVIVDDSYSSYYSYPYWYSPFYRTYYNPYWGYRSYYGFSP